MPADTTASAGSLPATVTSVPVERNVREQRPNVATSASHATMSRPRSRRNRVPARLTAAAPWRER